MKTLKPTLYISMTLYGIACLLPALIVQDSFRSETEVWFGGIILLMGWLGVLVGELAWLANLSLFIAWLLTFFKRSYLALIFSLLAIPLSLDVFRFNQLEIPADEAGNCCFILQNLSFGAYAWFASIAVVTLGLVIFIIGSIRHSKSLSSEHIR
jgi:hypothetical protein